MDLTDWLGIYSLVGSCLFVLMADLEDYLGIDCWESWGVIKIIEDHYLSLELFM